MSNRDSRSLHKRTHVQYYFSLSSNRALTKNEITFGPIVFFFARKVYLKLKNDNF